MKNDNLGFNLGLIWFGAAVSIAEIMTGTFLAPLGFSKGVAVILLGHAIGCFLLFLAAWIGARSGRSAMESVKISFGQKGALFFAALNIIQLLGWTAVMIAGGAAAADAIFSLGRFFWPLAIGALIVLWLFIGLKNVGKINVVTVGALFILSLLLSRLIFGAPKIAAAGLSASLSFGAGLELAIAMPLSWLPLIADYTKDCRGRLLPCAVSALTYFAVSSWMYLIGLGAALFTGEGDIARIMLSASLGVPALLIVVFSTVTTTFLDAYSAGVSAVSCKSGLDEKKVAVAVCLTGTALAVFCPVLRFEGFLYFISSVFAPMAAVLFSDWFLLKQDHSAQPFGRANLLIWAAGFVCYRLFMQMDLPLGATVPAMLFTCLLCLLCGKLDKGGRLC